MNTVLVDKTQKQIPMEIKYLQDRNGMNDRIEIKVTKPDGTTKSSTVLVGIESRPVIHITKA